MLLVIAFTIVIIGILILIALIAFYPVKEDSIIEDNKIYKKNEIEDINKSSDVLVKDTDNYHHDNKDSIEKGKNEYLPVLNTTIPIEGLDKELVHYEGSGIFYQIENEKEVSEITSQELEISDETKKIKGKVYLTTKWIVLVNEHTKKIALKAIDNYKFIDNFFLIKRKRVKKKKDVFKIIGNSAEFYYITKVLLKK